MLGEQSFQPYAINTFSHRGKNFEEITPIHYVRPHEVRPYSRRDGTFVSGYWRDGDGDTTINRQTRLMVKLITALINSWINQLCTPHMH